MPKQVSNFNWDAKCVCIKVGADEGVILFPTGFSIERLLQGVNVAPLEAAPELASGALRGISIWEGHHDAVAEMDKLGGKFRRPNPQELDAITKGINPWVSPLATELCDGCHQAIDPDTCECGEAKERHGNVMSAGHGFVPMGCGCFRVRGGTLG